VPTIWNLPLLYFPHLWTVFLLGVICGVAKYKDKETLFLSSFIGLVGAVELLSYFVQMVIAAIFESHIYAFVAALSWLASLGINLAYFMFFTKKLTDPTFDQWAEANPKPYKTVNIISLLLSFKLTRFHFCKFAGLKYFKGSFLYPNTLHKPLVWATVASAVFSYVPIVVSDIVGLSLLYWGN
jgi:hypothetical protein